MCMRKLFPARVLIVIFLAFTRLKKGIVLGEETAGRKPRNTGMVRMRSTPVSLFLFPGKIPFRKVPPGALGYPA